MATDDHTLKKQKAIRDAYIGLAKEKAQRLRNEADRLLAHVKYLQSLEG